MITNNSELALQQAMQLPSQTNTEKQGCSQPHKFKLTVRYYDNQ